MYSDHRTGRMESSYLTEGKKRMHEEGGIFVIGLKDRKNEQTHINRKVGELLLILQWIFRHVYITHT